MMNRIDKIAIEHLREKIVTDILSGVYDSNLESVKDAVTKRLELVEDQEAAILLSKIKSGDKIRLKNIRPKYLEGAIGTVTPRQLKMNSKSGKLHVTLDEPIKRYSSFKVHVSCVELVEGEDDSFPQQHQKTYQRSDAHLPKRQDWLEAQKKGDEDED